MDDGVIGIDEYINKYAPTLSNDIKELQKNKGLFGRIKGWTLEYGVAGKSSHVDTQNKSIVIDPNKKGNLDELVRSIAHEVGHAKYNTPFDASTRRSYVTSFLRDEGAAMVSNLMVRDEILSNGGHDVGISGNITNHSQYESIYKLHGDTPEAYDQIATIFGSNEKVKDGRTYNDYYGDFYDATYSK